LSVNTDIYLLGATAIQFAGRVRPTDDSHLLIRSSALDSTQIPLKRYRPTDVVKFTQPNDLNMSHSGSIFFKTAWQIVGGYQPDHRQRVIAYSDRDFQLRIASLLPVAVSSQVPFAYWRSDSSVDQGRNT
jgi:hypothetical protein